MWSGKTTTDVKMTSQSKGECWERGTAQFWWVQSNDKKLFQIAFHLICKSLTYHLLPFFSNGTRVIHIIQAIIETDSLFYFSKTEDESNLFWWSFLSISEKISNHTSVLLSSNLFWLYTNPPTHVWPQSWIPKFYYHYQLLKLVFVCVIRFLQFMSWFITNVI